MDTPRKNNDCYFYYYSTCRKGDVCQFRHEPSALGCETTCSYWQQGKCLNQRCNFRHMELRKNRKLIPCYWENQPGGCRKPHCSFQHKNSRDPVAVLDRDEPAGLPSERASYDESVANNDVGARRVPSEPNFGNPPIDPLVVNFEEESDSESAPTTTTPVKTAPVARRLVVKTLDEIRLERVQAEQAALFSYKGQDRPDLRTWLRRERSPPQEHCDTVFVKTLEQIRAERAANAPRKRAHSPVLSGEAPPPEKKKAGADAAKPVKLQRNPGRWSLGTDVPGSGGAGDRTREGTPERLEGPGLDDACDQDGDRTSGCVERPARAQAQQVNGKCGPDAAADSPHIVNGAKLRDSLELEDELLSDSHTDVMNIRADEDILQDIDNLLMD